MAGADLRSLPRCSSKNVLHSTRRQAPRPRNVDMWIRGELVPTLTKVAIVRARHLRGEEIGQASGGVKHSVMIAHRRVGSLTGLEAPRRKDVVPPLAASL